MSTTPDAERRPLANDYRTLWLAASDAHRKMFAWFVFAAVQALCWMGVALWALTK